MQSLAFATDYREILRSAYSQRASRNPSYSLRAFARDLGISSSRLSEVLSGRDGLSSEVARRIAVALGLSGEEMRHFCDLSEARHARSRIKREQAQARLCERSLRNPSYRLDADSFRLISDWYHFAILELTLTRGFQSDPAWIAEALGIPELLAREAVSRLLRTGLLTERDGRLVASDDFTDTSSEIPSEAIRRFHQQILEKAIDAIHLQSLEERELGAMVLAIRRDRIPEAKEWVRKVQKEFAARFGEDVERDEVYVLSTQLFSLKGK